MEFKFETISNSQNCISGCFTERACVFGGWIVRTVCWDTLNECQSESSVFVPDERHEWEIEKV